MHTNATEAQQHSAAFCQHHWVIDTPNGALSGGRCKRCGANREFRNSSEDLLWDSDSFSLNGTRYRGRRKDESTASVS
jgi:hypothetical protein